MRACPTCGAQFVEGEQFCPYDADRLEEISNAGFVTQPDPLLGQVLDGRYRILRELGSGGMGKVYEAEHVTIGRAIAVKVLRDSEAANPEMVARFRQEAQSATRIGHESIVEVLDFGTTPTGAAYMVMELLRGRDLAATLSADGPFAPERCVRILLEATTALDAAHRMGIVHRDLKPENLFLCQDEGGHERLKIVDFGLAKMSDLERTLAPAQRLTKTGMIFGTPKYMSPEQCGGKPADARSDIYALGIIAYQMLTGRPPFDASSFLGVINMHLFDTPPPMLATNPKANVPDALEAAVNLALAKDPEQRPPTMADFGELLRAAIGFAPTRPSSPPRSAHASSPRASVDVYGMTMPASRESQRPGRRETPDALRLRLSMRDMTAPVPRQSGGPERFVWPLILLVLALGAGAFYFLRP